MKRAFRFYFETSVWRRMVERDDPRRILTYRLATIARRRHEILTSREAVNELGEIPDPQLRRAALLRLRRTDPEMVPVSARVRAIAKELLGRGGWGPKDLEDMLHIGYAMVGAADVLVTWDQADLARSKTRRLVLVLGREWDLRAPDIATPVEVLNEWLGVRMRLSRR